MQPTANINESILAGRLLTIMAARISENLATFSGWLVGSFAAILALLISNIDTTSKFLPTQCVGSSALLFLTAVVLYVLQRYIAAIVAGSVAVGKEAETLVSGQALNLVLVMEEIEKSTYWPARIIVRRSLAKIRAGDFAASGRTMAKLGQVQGFLVLGQMASVVSAAYVLARAL